MKKEYIVNNGWEFSLKDKTKESGSIKANKWYKATVPGSVYHNLINNNLIPEPFYADNELRLQWVAHCDWSYRNNFNMPGDFDPSKEIYLHFNGLDTIAEIILNGEPVSSTNNMFLKYEFEVSGLLKKKNNLLEINFTSPYKYARGFEEKYGKLRVALNSERVYIRKAQYSFGWDWGPVFTDSGIWKDVALVQKADNSIENFLFDTKSISESNAEVKIKLTFNKPLTSDNEVQIEFRNADKVHEFTVMGIGESMDVTLNIPEPGLWWPSGEGEQNLYDIKITLFKNGIAEDEINKKAGIRTVELQLKDGDKNTFRFIINGRKIFAKGTNWIPSDSFLTRTQDSKYRELLTLAKDGNMNFIRVWGGGIYEKDIFYELCDELGLLVWQDFMFACAAYPQHEEFLNNVSSEVFQNVNRLQHHPCIAIWCGNNENEWIWYQEQKTSYTNMPGYKIYNQLIPDILKSIDPVRPYWQSSPFSFEEDPNSVLSGNRHQWDLWSRWIDYNAVAKDDSLFVTEFGFQGPANHSTLEKVIPSEQRNPQSYLFEFHNKQVEGNERQFKFLSGHLPVRTTWDDFIYLAQLSQGLALKKCLEHWRLNQPVTNGTIIWQLNDCWPVASWAIVDSDSKPKLSYYFVKQIFGTQLLSIKQADNKGSLILSGKINFKGYFELAEVSLVNGKSKILKKAKVVSESEKNILYTVNVSKELAEGKSILVATLFDNKNVHLHRTVHTPLEWKHLKLPAARIKTKLIKNDDGYYVTLRSDSPAFFVSVFSDELILGKNAVTLLPGEDMILPVTNNFKSKKHNLKVFTINNYLS